MELNVFLLLIFLKLAFGGSHAALPVEVYWNSVFPYTAMPTALKDLLLPPAESTPFSSDKFPGILRLFSLKTESVEAKVMKRTVANCERPAIEKEDKYFASLESFVDFSVSKFGKNIKPLSSEMEIKETEDQEFSIASKGLEIMGEKEMACHKMKYPYAVFLCHSLDKTAVYKVPSVGNDATKVKALAVCHKDTSAWNQSTWPFEFLKLSKEQSHLSFPHEREPCLGSKLNC
ncbi:hypothetical protein SCA6_010860 [Theobroma cacao]